MEKVWNRNFILLASSNFLNCVTYYAIVSVLPIYISVSLHADKGMVGIVMATFLISSVLIRPFSAFALERYGRRTIFTTALFIHSLLFIGYILANHVGAIAVICTIHGITWGVSTISGSILVADNIPNNKRGEGFGYYGLFTTLAMTVGPVFGLFVYTHLGYIFMFLAITFISLSSFLCTLFIYYPKFDHSKKVHFRWGNLLDINSVSSSLNLLIIMSAYGGLLSFVALYGKEIGVQNTSWFFLVFAIGIASARFGVGRIFDKHGPGKLLTFSLLLLIGGFFYLALLKTHWAYYSSGILLGYGIGAVFPTFQAIINNMASADRRGAANSTLYTALDLGMGAGMIVTGYIGEHFSISLAFMMCALIILAGLIYFRTKTMHLYEKVRIR